MSKPKDDLISRAAALEAIDGIKPIYKEQLAMKALCWAAVKSIPAVDTAPVVRCHKCVHWDRKTVRQNSNDGGWWNEAICERHTFDGLDRIEKWTDADWFCADGKRRDEGETGND
jgi:hypothetical protein